MKLFGVFTLFALTADGVLSQSIKVPMAPNQSMTIRIVSNVLVNCGHDASQCSIFSLDSATGAPRLITNVTTGSYPYQEMVLDSVNQIVYLYIAATQPNDYGSPRLQLYSIRLPLTSAANVSSVGVSIPSISGALIMAIDYQDRFLYLIADSKLLKYDIKNYVPVLMNSRYSTMLSGVEQWGPRMAGVSNGYLYYASYSSAAKYVWDLTSDVILMKQLQNDNNPTRCVGFFNGQVLFSTEYYSGGNTGFAFSNFTLNQNQVNNYVSHVPSVISEPVEFLMLDENVMLYADRDLQKVQLIRINNGPNQAPVTVLASVPAQVPHGVVWYGNYVYVSTWGDAQASGILYFRVSSNTTDGMGQLRQFANPSRFYGMWMRQFAWLQSSITQNITVGTTRSLIDLTKGVVVYRSGLKYAITIQSQSMVINCGDVVAYSFVNGSLVASQLLFNQSDLNSNPQITIQNGNSGLGSVKLGVSSGDTSAVLKFVAFNERGTEQVVTLAIQGQAAPTTSAVSTVITTTSTTRPTTSTTRLTTSTTRPTTSTSTSTTTTRPTTTTTTKSTTTTTTTTSQIQTSTIVHIATGVKSMVNTTSITSSSSASSTLNHLASSSVTEVSTQSSPLPSTSSSMSQQFTNATSQTQDLSDSTASWTISSASPLSDNTLQSLAPISATVSVASVSDSLSQVQSQTSSYASNIQFNAFTGVSQFSSSLVQNAVTTSLVSVNQQQQQVLSFDLQLIIILTASLIAILTLVAIGCAYRKRRATQRKRMQLENLYQNGSMTNTTTFPMADVNSATVLNATIPYSGTVMGNETAILSQY
ncbi:hypothetical protein MP228_010766 [Amoeboaphelidium protococcarum]|nr:hypothetical protein MP228_010766 [Amoeboaphelidium protococcarum]